MKISALDNEYKGILFEISRGEKKSYLCPIVNGLFGRTILKPKLSLCIVNCLKNANNLFIPQNLSSRNEKLMHDAFFSRFIEISKPNEQEESKTYAFMKLRPKTNTMNLQTDDPTLFSLLKSWSLFVRIREKVGLDRPKCVEKLIAKCKTRGSCIEELEQLCDFEGRLEKKTPAFEELEKNEKLVKKLQGIKKDLMLSYKKGEADELCNSCQKLRSLYKVKAEEIEVNQRNTVDILEECFQRDGSFVFLGALSFFYFREEIVQSLKDRGYSVTRIFPS